MPSPIAQFGLENREIFTTDKYAQRVNPDSTIDLICLSCFRTVATVNPETDVAAIKAKHTCEPLEPIDIDRYMDSQRGTF